MKGSDVKPSKSICNKFTEIYLGSSTQNCYVYNANTMQWYLNDVNNSYLKVLQPRRMSCVIVLAVWKWQFCIKLIYIILKKLLTGQLQLNCFGLICFYTW